MAALISGMMTLVATAPNLVIHAELIRQGHEGFIFFAFTPFGVPVLLLAVLYMPAAQRFLSPGETAEVSGRAALRSWVEDYAIGGREHRLQVMPGSGLSGQRLDTLDLRASAGINIIAIERGKLISPQAATVLEAGDILMIDQRVSSEKSGFDFASFARTHGLAELPVTEQWLADTTQEIGMAQILVPLGSRLTGKTLMNAKFRSVYGLSVIGMKHGTEPVPEAVTAEVLQAGDTLLAAGPWRSIRNLADERRDLVLLDLPAESENAVHARQRALRTLAVLALVVSGIVPNVQAGLFGCLLLGLFRCIGMAEAYRPIHWQSLILIVGMLPFSLALQRGGVDIAASLLLDILGEASPHLVLAALFATTSVLGLFISNTATAVLMAPVALAVAQEMNTSPYPFAMTVALAASAAFMTPVSSPVNTLVVGPGNYRFGEFMKIGVPFTLITLLASVLLVPLILPF
ncbi:SLC13 family permease [Pannonibacter indicus]|uniref:SLC13 family permease n=1 Tax=Pannonibacter indicus TaxID=466044 RepID=UPI003919BA77